MTPYLRAIMRADPPPYTNPVKECLSQHPREHFDARTVHAWLKASAMRPLPSRVEIAECLGWLTTHKGGALIVPTGSRGRWVSYRHAVPPPARPVTAASASEKRFQDALWRLPE